MGTKEKYTSHEKVEPSKSFDNVTENIGMSDFTVFASAIHVIIVNLFIELD
jgi:hypothetical protein